MAAGRTSCTRCGLPIDPLEKWDLGHSDDGRSWTGPEHMRCNRSHGGKLRAEQLYGKKKEVDGPPRWSRHWSGGFTERCRECRRLGYACLDAETEEERRAWEEVHAQRKRRRRRTA